LKGPRSNIETERWVKSHERASQLPTHPMGAFKEPRPPPNALKSTPIFLALTGALAYISYSVYASSAALPAADARSSQVPFWKRSVKPSAWGGGRD